MPTLNELVIQMTDDLQRDTANADVWVNGNEVATYTDTNARIIPSIQKLVADFENRTEYTGVYVGSGTAYIRGQTFNETYAAYTVTADFTSTTFGADSANYKISFDLNTIVQAAIDSASAAATSETNAGVSATASEDAALASTIAANAAGFSETNAATSETNAAISETNAAASAIAAAAVPAPQLNPKAFAGGVAFDGLGQVNIDKIPAISGDFYFGILLRWSGQDEAIAGKDGNNYLAMQSSVSRLLLRINGSNKAYSKAFTEGKWMHLGLSRSGSTCSVYMDGVLDGTFDIGTAPLDWNYLASDGVGPIDNWTGGLTAATFFNTSVTATQAQEIYQQGISGWLAANPEYRWAATSPSYESDWSSTVDGWTQAGVGAIASSGGFLDLTASGAGVAGAREQSAVMSSLGLSDNDWVRISFLTRYVSGSTGSGGLTFTIQASTDPLWDVRATATFSPVTAWERVTYDVQVLSAGANSFPYLRCAVFAADDQVQFDDFSITKLGCLANLPMDEGVGYQLHDQSPNHFDALLTETGTTHLIPKREGFIRDFNVDAYNGGAGGAFLVTSTQLMLPATPFSTVTEATVTNRAAGAVGSLEIGRSTTAGVNQDVLTATSMALPTDASIKIGGTTLFQRTDEYKRSVRLSSTDADATDLDVRVDYKLID